MRGFTLVEVMVALVLLSLSAVALAHCLLLAQRLQIESGRWMRAAALAQEGLERARTLGCEADDVAGLFLRRCASTTSDGLRGIEVTVTWAAPEQREFRLATVVVQ